MRKILDVLKMVAFCLAWLAFGFGFAGLLVLDGMGAFSLA
jgi:hypothetical protein